MLRQAVENRSKGFNSTATHPHKSFPGIPHYMNNQFLPPIRSHPPYSPKTPPESNRYSSISTDREVATTKHGTIGTLERLENSRFLSVKVAVSIGTKD
jgi:hypothetical protein